MHSARWSARAAPFASAPEFLGWLCSLAAGPRGLDEERILRLDLVTSLRLSLKFSTAEAWGMTRAEANDYILAYNRWAERQKRKR